jgi:hypothetical protein
MFMSLLMPSENLLFQIGNGRCLGCPCNGLRPTNNRSPASCISTRASTLLCLSSRIEQGNMSTYFISDIGKT